MSWLKYLDNAVVSIACFAHININYLKDKIILKQVELYYANFLIDESKKSFKVNVMKLYKSYNTTDITSNIHYVKIFHT